jgi:hypothetical protein
VKNKESDMPIYPPEDWPPPIYASPVMPSKKPEPWKVARHHAALGWTFIALGLLAPPLFLPTAIYYGWHAWRSGEVQSGLRIMGSATLMIIAVTITCCLIVRS